MGIKEQVRLEVIECDVDKFGDVAAILAKIALRVDSATWCVSSSRMRGSDGRQAGSAMPATTCIELDNVEREGSGSKRFEGQRVTDYRKRACFLCYKEGCRQWMHSKLVVWRVKDLRRVIKDGFAHSNEDDTEEHVKDSEN